MLKLPIHLLCLTLIGATCFRVTVGNDGDLVENQDDIETSRLTNKAAAANAITDLDVCEEFVADISTMPSAGNGTTLSLADYENAAKSNVSHCSCTKGKIP